MQRDPLGYAAGLNLYAYAGGDPVNARDPSGLDLEEIFVTCCRKNTYEIVEWGRDIINSYFSPSPQLANNSPSDMEEVKVTSKKLKEISSLLCFAKVTQPDLPIPDLGDISIGDLSQMDGMGGIALGRVGPYPWSGVELSNRFISPLRPLPGNTVRGTRYELFDTIIHETIHTNQNFLYRAFFAGRAEQTAWKEARRRSSPYAEVIRRGVAGSPGCGH